jgi:lipopolysaccharide/colanic/teichoic acid biosynthesis glycosyltransferase
VVLFSAMKIRSKSDALVLLVGDFIIFAGALWLTLLLRYQAVPPADLFQLHLAPFSLIFVIWVGVFFIADLYRSRPTTLLKRRLPQLLLNAQLANIIIAVGFFYFLPFFGITPRTVLFIYLAVSLGLIILWRRYLVPKIFRTKPEKIFFACAGPEVDEIIRELVGNPDHNLVVATELTERAIVVINPSDEKTAERLPGLYDFFFNGGRFVNVDQLYEGLFDRVPLSIINEYWFLQNISNHPKLAYNFFKRLIDIISALLLGLVPLVITPFVWLAIKLDDGGPLLYKHDRIGKNGRHFKLYKFRSMKDHQVTRVGRILRSSRLDELPQLWNVLRGDVTLVGPRPEMVNLAANYRREVAHYDVRHLITPGLSGWAQIYHDRRAKNHGEDREYTRGKLAYDLYYVKNRNLWLDLTIILKTIRELLSRRGV